MPTRRLYEMWPGRPQTYRSAISDGSEAEPPILTSAPQAVPLRNRCGESRCATFDCVLRPLTSFSSCPCLCFLDEPAQLFEQDAGGCALALDRLDSVEPSQYCAGVVHVDEASRRVRASVWRECVELVPDAARESTG